MWTKRLREEFCYDDVMNVLFICNGNVARSQEAEAYFNTMVNDPRMHAYSAGVNVKEGKPIDPLVVQAMREDGIVFDNAKRKPLTEKLSNTADLIISFKPADELPEYTRKLNVRYWNVEDPQDHDLNYHRMIRDKVRLLVRQLIDEISR